MFHTNKHMSYWNSSDSDIQDYYKQGLEISNGAVNLKDNA